MIYNLFQLLQEGHEGFSFYGLRKSDEGADTELMHVYNFCCPKNTKIVGSVF